MTTTEVFLIAMVIIFTVPYLIWRGLRTDYWAPLVVVQTIAGILLGPGVLGAAFPDYYDFVFRPPVVQALNGLALYRENIDLFSRAPRPPELDLPVQTIACLEDRFVTEFVMDSARPFLRTHFARRVNGGHWLPIDQPARFAAYVEELVRFVETGSLARPLALARVRTRTRARARARAVVAIEIASVLCVHVCSRPCAPLTTPDRVRPFARSVTA